MNTRAVLTASAVFLGVQGLIASFLPIEILGFVDARAHHRLESTLVQVLGAAMLGFAMMNWMARGAPAGGIYGRPLVVGNLVHYTVAAIALLKAASLGGMPTVAIILTMLYSLFAVLFAVVMFGRGPIGAIEHSGPG